MAYTNTEPKPSQRDCAIDTLKCIGAFLVVVLHFGYVIADDGIGRATFVVNALTRVAVPLFFMITGYYFMLSYHRGRIKQQITRLLSLTAFAVVLYAIFETGWSMLIGELPDLVENLRWHADPIREVSKVLVFNEIPKVYHLWYLPAAIMALTAMWAFEQWKLWGRPLIIFFVIVLLAASLMSAYSNVSKHYVRNFFTLGIPFMALGRWIYETQLNKPKWLTSRRVIFGCIILATTLIVAQIMVRINDFGIRYEAQFEIPLGVPILSCSLLLLALSFPMMGRNTLLPVIGAKYSGYIYVFQLIPGTILRHYIDLESELSLIMPFVVFAVSLAMSVLWVRLKSALPPLRILQLI